MKTYLKIILSAVALIVIACALMTYIIYGPSVKRQTAIFIPTNSTYEEVVEIIRDSNIVNITALNLVSKLKKYDNLVKPGKYVIDKGLSLSDFVNKLRSGNQDAVKLHLKKFRDLDKLASNVSKFIEADSATIHNLLLDSTFICSYNICEENVNKDILMACFIPNTYYVYWNTSAEKFFERILNEYNAFWTKERIAKAKEMKLSQIEVSILASIVDEETNHIPEKPTIASVYLNRLRMGMPLQADPTVKFALGDFYIRRITKKDLKINSPYNTYRYKGLPIGTICSPSISAIDAVLENKKTPYIFFCADSSFSGSHFFAKTYSEHLRNARMYHKALNERGIMR